MSITLAAAASATGLNKTTILRAVKDGRISGSRDARGVWHVEPGELHLLRPLILPRDAGDACVHSDADAEELGTQIEMLLRQAGDRLRQQLDEVRRENGYDPAQDRRLHFAEYDDRSA